MTRNSRNALMATTLLAGIAICSFDIAQAGPNSIGGGGGSFSSMRMDFGRIGSASASRALAPEDRRIVRLDVSNKAAKKDDRKKKSVARKGGGTNLGSTGVINPNSTTGGQGKEDVGSGRDLHIPAALAEAYRITGGNLGDLSLFGEIENWIRIGLPVVPDPLNPGKGDGGSWTPPVPPPGGGEWGFGEGNQRDHDAERDRLINGGSAGRAPQPFGNPNGKVSEGGPTATDHTRNLSHWWPGHAKDESTQATARGDMRNAYEWMPPKPKDEPTASAPRVYQPYDKVSDPKPDPVAIAKDPNETWYQASEPKEGDEHEAAHGNEPDSQPAGEGYGRPANGGRGGWCSPTGGCRTVSAVPLLRIIPTEDSGLPESRRQSPLWATDPVPDGLGHIGGGGGGYTGYRPQNEGDGDNGAPGNPH